MKCQKLKINDCCQMPERTAKVTTEIQFIKTNPTEFTFQVDQRLTFKIIKCPCSDALNGNVKGMEA